MTMFGREPAAIGHFFAFEPVLYEEDKENFDEEKMDISERDAAVERGYISPGGRAEALKKIRELDVEVMRLISIAVTEASEKNASIKAALEKCSEALARVEKSSSVLWPREARFRRHMAQMLDMQNYRGRARKQRKLASEVEKMIRERGILMIHSWKVHAR